MKSRLFVIFAAVPVLLLLAACAPSKPVAIPEPHLTYHPGAHPSVIPKPKPTLVVPTPTAPASINAADYLVDGAPNVPDANGEWSATWAFYTDSTKTVFCTLTTLSDDAGGAGCAIVPGKTSLATYPIPAGASNNCDQTASLASDGYSLFAGVPALGPGVEAGWGGCATNYYYSADDLAKAKVLPNGSTLSVETYTCSATAGVATCSDVDSYNGGTGTITLGLHVAKFSQIGT